MNTETSTQERTPGSLHPACSTAFVVQHWRAGEWKTTIDCGTLESAIEVRNHLAATRRQKFRAVKITTEEMP
jgi:hypothetical protein